MRSPLHWARAAARAVAAVLACTAGITDAQAARICVPLLSGTQCVQFLEGRPAAPGLSKGMSIRVVPTQLTDGTDLTVTAAGFAPNEGLRRFNYNIFGPGRMNEYSGEFRRADAKGRFSWIVSPSTAIYQPSWGTPALCLYGQRSRRLACTSFTVAGMDTVAGGMAAGNAPAGALTGGGSPTPQSPTTPAEGNCKDMGFTTLCTN